MREREKEREKGWTSGRWRTYARDCRGSVDSNHDDVYVYVSGIRGDVENSDCNGIFSNDFPLGYR